MLHIMKLAVGAQDIEHIRSWQASRAANDPPIRHLTRNSPKRAEEVLDGGSLYWIVAGAMVVRQRIIDIRPDERQDGTACTALVLDPELVPVLGRPMRAFQGWRYMEADAAPLDVTAAPTDGTSALPPKLMQELRALCLI
jgi:hypothetical protein